METSNRHLPAIVIVGYNRLESLQRVMGSVLRAELGSDIPLVISLDGGGPPAIGQWAEQLSWPHGDKTVVCHPNNLGLRQHILSCGDFTQKYGAAIVLEDDVWVGPDFYNYACQALDASQGQDQVAGVSLYRQEVSQITWLPFAPTQDGSDAFYMQIPTSWGQAWTSDQWSGFRAWLAENADFDFSQSRLPSDVLRWPSESSWKKFFFQYMLSTDKYFSFPFVSQATCFNDEGVHTNRSNLVWQSSIQMGVGKQYAIPTWEQSESVYDSTFNPLACRMKKRNPELESYDFEPDLYGTKDLSKITKPWVLTCRSASVSEKTFGAKLRPLELNVAFNVSGDDLRLARVQRTDPAPKQHYHLIGSLYPQFSRGMAMRRYKELLGQSLRRRFRRKPS